MKKIVGILLIVMLLSGCDVNYHLSFEDERLTENIQLSIPNENDREIDDLKRTNAYAIFDGLGNDKYNVNFKEGKQNFTADYDFEYTLTNFGRAYYINQCFDAVNFAKNNNKYTLWTTQGFKCMLFEYYRIDNLKITITTNHHVLENNADEKKGNTYIWNVNEENADDVKINMVFGGIRSKNFFDYYHEHPIFVIGLIVIAVSGVIYLIISAFKIKKNNEM